MLDRLHAVHKDPLGLQDFLVLMSKSQINELLSLLEGFDGGLDVWRVFVNFFQSSQSFGNNPYVVLVLNSFLQHREKKINLVLVVVHVVH